MSILRLMANIYTAYLLGAGFRCYTMPTIKKTRDVSVKFTLGVASSAEKNYTVDLITL
ncbi:hypothetical protein MTsDn1_27600 [Alteromonas sp. MTD1]